MLVALDIRLLKSYNLTIYDIKSRSRKGGRIGFQERELAMNEVDHRDESRKKFRYCVLYIQERRQQRLKEIIERHIPKDRGEVFCPYMEYYRRGEKKIKIRAIFPGYVFIYSDMNILEIHELLKQHWREINMPMRELALRERQIAEPDFLHRQSENVEFDLSDLNSQEEKFLDFLRMGDGLLRMSSGYEEDHTYHVMEGPLRAYEEQIQAVDKHNKKAFLKFEIQGHRVQAGFECKPKSHWYPTEEAELVALEDGTEVDLSEIRKSVMKIR